MRSRLKNLSELGQAVWLDFLERGFLTDGSLKKLILEDGLTGVTSNPSIFEKAIGSSEVYKQEIKRLLENGDASTQEIYEHLAIADIRTAADLLQPVYERSKALDGYVSLEVSPNLARSVEGTLAEGRRLWQAVNRTNLMIKVPATAEGIIAVRTLIAEGINVNITLIFTLETYEKVLDAYISGLEDRVAANCDISNVASVASFFISRVDSAVNKAIDQRIVGNDPKAGALMLLKGKLAIAGAKMAYQYYLKTKDQRRWQALSDKDAMPQRLLWASTGTKDPSYSDVLYVEALIGNETVNTMPPATMNAFRHHGEAKLSLISDLNEAEQTLAQARSLGLDLQKIGSELLEDGLLQFLTAAALILDAVGTV
jgi:transaldolase/glucose-6-phosphate isomerase